ncbi:MAG: restriction endonuclease subunit S [Methanosarcinales archaeon]|nr:restriction endonuclease subunit S [Methanosarcinales archaeon]
MKHELVRYNAHKDSGVEWLDEVPEHWGMKRVKDLALLQSGDSIVSEQIEDEGPYPVYGGNGLRGYFSRYTNNGDHILIGRQGALCGNINYAHGKFWASEHAVVVYLNSGIVMKWYGEMLKVMYLNQYSLSAAQPGLAMDRIKRLLLPVPPLSEQKSIAAYLNTKTVQIDRKIDLLTQKATQYGKLKQSLINETVTSGLDKSVAMKDSGVEWIGEVPEHWKVNRLKNLAYIKTGGKDTIDNVEEGAYPFFVRSQTIERINSYSFDGEAILTAGDGVGVGKVFHHVNCKFDYHQRVYKISNFRDVVGKFIFYYMRENFHKDALRLNAKSTVDSLRMPMFQNFTIAFGDIEEQQAIVDYLDTKTAKIDRIVETINTQIEKLKELRKTLINDVVTGKIKVAQ